MATARTLFITVDGGKLTHSLLLSKTAKSILKPEFQLFISNGNKNTETFLRGNMLSKIRFCKCRSHIWVSKYLFMHTLWFSCTSIYFSTSVLLLSVLWRCWLGGRKGIRPVKTEWWGVGVVICLERGADLHAQLMPLPLPLTVSCFSKIQIGFTFLLPAYLGSPGKRAVKRVCVCIYFSPA